MHACMLASQKGPPSQPFFFNCTDTMVLASKTAKQNLALSHLGKKIIMKIRRKSGGFTHEVVQDIRQLG